MADGGHEPSMEDILSSIKRIIAEDSDAALSGPRTKRSVTPPRADRAATTQTVDDEDDVLELTDAVEPSPTAQRMMPTQAAPEAAKLQPEPPQAAPEPALVSPSTVEASRSSFAALSALVVKPEVTGSDTLEGLVRDMLKPMIAQWLDARLPEIVEREVAREVRRISERG